VAPDTAGSGAFNFPLRTGFGNPKNFNGVLVHKGGLKFSKGTKSAVVRGFVAVRHGKRAKLLAKVPGLKGGCKVVRKEIRRWERKMQYPHLPIIALSANVLGDVYSKCVEAGFNSYVTKPVEFKELSLVLTKYLDPTEKGKPHEFMVPKLSE